MKSNSLRIVHTEASLGWGGQEIRILTEAQGLIGRGHQVEIWAAPGSNILPEAARRSIPARVLPIGTRGLRPLLAVREMLKEDQPDIVNTHSSTDTWLVALACLTLRDPPPVVRTRHISAPVSKDFATRWLYLRATRHIVTTGERLRQTLIHDNGFAPQRITSVPTGIDTRRFRPGDKKEARRQLGLQSDSRYLGIVATLRSWKGHLYLIDAVARLAKDFGDLRLAIVGDGPMLPALEQRAKESGVAERVLFAGRQAAVETWLQALDVFCLPSYANEGVPQALLQAMLTGLPIVTTPVGSILEAVTDGETGLIVPPKDVDAMVISLRCLFNDAELAQRFGAAARRFAIDRFGIDNMLDRMEAIFHDVTKDDDSTLSAPA